MVSYYGLQYSIAPDKPASKTPYDSHRQGILSGSNGFIFMFTVSCLRPETCVAMINDEPIVKSALASSDIWPTQEGAYN